MEKNITMIICNMYHYILHTYNNRYPFTFLYYALIRLYISIVSFIIPLNCYRTLPTFTYLHTHNSNTFYTFTNKFYRSFTSKYPLNTPKSYPWLAGTEKNVGGVCSIKRQRIMVKDGVMNVMIAGMIVIKE